MQPPSSKRVIDLSSSSLNVPDNAAITIKFPFADKSMLSLNLSQIIYTGIDLVAMDEALTSFVAAAAGGSQVPRQDDGTECQ